MPRKDVPLGEREKKRTVGQRLWGSAEKRRKKYNQRRSGPRETQPQEGRRPSRWRSRGPAAPAPAARQPTGPALGGSAGTAGSISFWHPDLGGEERRREPHAPSFPLLAAPPLSPQRWGASRCPQRAPLPHRVTVAPATSSPPGRLQILRLEGEKGKEDLNESGRKPIPTRHPLRGWGQPGSGEDAPSRPKQLRPTCLASWGHETGPRVMNLRSPGARTSFLHLFRPRP